MPQLEQQRPLDAFYELGPGTFTVTFYQHEESAGQETTVNFALFLGENGRRGDASVGCILRQAKDSINTPEETTPRIGFRGEGGGWALHSSSKGFPAPGLVGAGGGGCFATHSGLAVKRTAVVRRARHSSHRELHLIRRAICYIHTSYLRRGNRLRLV